MTPHWCDWSVVVFGLLCVGLVGYDIFVTRRIHRTMETSLRLMEQLWREEERDGGRW